MKPLSILTLLAGVTNAYRFAWRPDTKVFPYDVFPVPSLIDNGDNGGKYIAEEILPQEVELLVIKCIDVWIGNGACNLENNKAECDWDGGDCCRLSCEVNCAFKLENEAEGYKPCQFDCGSFGGFTCLHEEQGCSMCSEHGQCRSQDQCVQSTEKGLIKWRQEKLVANMIDACHSISWSMGDVHTVDNQCGRDPDRNVVHDINYKQLHFPGCGYLSTQCTKRKCCEDVLHNEIWSRDCLIDDEPDLYIFYNSDLQVYKEELVKCYDHFQECFEDNYKYYGQCCQCLTGWTGIDCTQAVCWPICVHGSCLEPDLCICEPGWQGVICDIGVCEKCEYGLCVAPEQCNCFYGYEGHSCDIPISYPPCVNGETIEPNLCVCDDGWDGRICDVPICDPPCGQGYCLRPDVCECEPGWFSSDEESICDTLDPLMHDPNCRTSDNDSCLECMYGYYWDPDTHLCWKCNEWYDQMCIECDHLQCLECQWPYHVENVHNTCVNYGVLEFTGEYQDVSENEDKFWLYVRRNYGLNTTVTVEFDMTMTNPPYTRIEYRHDTLVFDDQIAEVEIEFKVFKRPYFETDDSLTTFEVYLLHPSEGAEIGWRDNVTVRYFDDESINDAEHTYATLQGHRPFETTDDWYWTPELQLGVIEPVEIFSYYQPDLPKNDGEDVFFIVERSIQRRQLREVLRSFHVEDNQHRVMVPIYDLHLKFLHVYSSTPGISANYFPNTLFEDPPFIQRIERKLPQIVTQQEIKTWNFFSYNATFVATFDVTPWPEKEEITFIMQLAENAEAELYFNDTLIIKTKIQDCHHEFLTERELPLDRESCCQQEHRASVVISGGVPYHFHLKYIQWSQAYNGMCVRIDRESDSLVRDSVDMEAQAITELDDSPFTVIPKQNHNFVSTVQSTFTLVPHQNINTNYTLAQEEIQACFPTLYAITLRDWFFYEVFGLPDLVIEATLDTQTGSQTNSSYFDPEGFERTSVNDGRHYVYLNYCGTVDQSAVLSLTINGEHLGNSPRVVTVLPGPYKLAKSDFYQDDEDDECHALTICYIRLDMRDDAYNLVRAPNLYETWELDFQMQGPITINGETVPNVWFKNITVAEEDPYEIRIWYKTPAPGDYYIFARFEGEEAPVYPIGIEVFTVIADPENSYVVCRKEDPDCLTPQIVSITMTFFVQLADASGNHLTLSNYNFKIYLVNQADTSIEFQMTYAEQQGSSLYYIEIADVLIRGDYNLHIFVSSPINPDEFTNPLKDSPYPIYWQPHYAHHSLTTLGGSGSVDVSVGFIESLVIEVRDKFGNQYNEEFHVTAEPVYRLEMIGILNVDEEHPQMIVNFESYPFEGIYIDQFRITEVYETLTLTVEVYSYDVDTESYSYQHIPGSPFDLNIIGRSYEIYCEYTDLLEAGFGFTYRSYVESYNAVQTVNQDFAVKFSARTLFLMQYVSDHDPLEKVFQLDFVPEQADGSIAEDICVCSPHSQDYCIQHSGSYEDCSMNKQCRWQPLSIANEGTSYGSCLPCNQTAACSLPEHSHVTPRVQTDDGAYFYYTQSILTQGTYRLQLNVLTQGSLTMLIYANPDFTDLVGVQRFIHFDTEFTNTLAPFFGDQIEHWSVMIVGIMRFTELCSILDSVKVDIETDGGLSSVTFTVRSNLDVTINFDGVVVFEKAYDIVQDQQFEMKLYESQYLDVEIRLSDVDPRPQLLSRDAFFSLEEETFNMPRRFIKPFNMFNWKVLSSSLTQSVTVLPAIVNGPASTVSAESTGWADRCDTLQKLQRVPFELPQTRIQVRDAFGNQRLLDTGDVLTQKIYRGTSWDDMSEVVFESTTFVEESNKDYSISTTITEAFFNYIVEFYVNGEALPQHCEVSLINAAVDVEASTASIIQQNKYFGHNTCVFAGEISHLVIDMRDPFSNVVPILDGEAYFDKYVFEFAGGSEFYNRDCLQYGPVEDHVIICQIRPSTSALGQTLAAVDTSDGRSFIGYPLAVDVHTSLLKKLSTADLNDVVITMAGASMIARLTLIDVWGNLLEIQTTPCSYFQHPRLIYMVGVHQDGGNKHEQSYDLQTSFSAGQLEFQVTNLVQQEDLYFNYTLLDGLQLESGIDLKFYLTDNFGLKSEQLQPYKTERVPQTLVTSSAQSPTWFELHQQHDRFSIKASTVFLPKYTQRYFFSHSIVTSGSFGVELWVDDNLVIGEGQTTGSIDLKAGSWASIKLYYRVTENNFTSVPQFFLQMQSTSQVLDTLNAASADVVALDMEEYLQVEQALVIKDAIQLQVQ